MTQEEKQLLLKDLCARLPYNVIVEKDGRKCVALTITSDGEIEIERGIGYYRYYDIQDVRPYLRPMSSMTKEESKELWELLKKLGLTTDVKRLDWLNKKMFDIHCLIPMGLALEASEGMYEL